MIEDVAGRRKGHIGSAIHGAMVDQSASNLKHTCYISHRGIGQDEGIVQKTVRPSHLMGECQHAGTIQSACHRNVLDIECQVSLYVERCVDAEDAVPDDGSAVFKGGGSITLEGNFSACFGGQGAAVVETVVEMQHIVEYMNRPGVGEWPVERDITRGGCVFVENTRVGDADVVIA